jgi:hypothetical protein
VVLFFRNAGSRFRVGGAVTGVGVGDRE